MMITIHGLPPKTTFQAVKALVKQECNIIDFICDNLVDDGPNSRKVRIGVSDDAEGYRILKCLNGFRMSPTHLLKIVPVGKPLNPHPPQNYDQRPNFQNEAQDDYSNQSRPDYQNPPMDNYGRIVKDTRKGNYIPPNMRKKKLPQGADDLRTAGPLMPPEIHRQSLEQLHRERNSHSSGPHGIGTRSQDSRHPLVESQDMMNSPQWGPNRNSSNNEWAPPGQGMQGQNSYNQRPNQGGFGQQGHSQGLQDSYSQGRGPLSEGFGFQTKPTVSETVTPTAARDTRQHVLRAVDIVDAQPPARQYAQDKPITIMKDNFQGPSHYGAASQQNNSGQGQPPVWSMTQQTKHQYDDRHPPIDKRPDAPKQDYEKRGHFIPMGSSRPISPSRPGISTTRSYQEPNRRISPTRQFPERRVSPNRLGPAVRDFSPSGRRVSPGRRFSPGRKMSPGRRMSPSDRRMSPGRRYSPGRKMSPGRKYSPGRKMSPGRRFSPGRKDDGRRMSPSEARRMGRRESPRRYSPTRRLASPVRQRFSPNRLGDKPADKFLDNKGQKPVRPAYELPQAQNQSYTGGYRDSAQYPTRQEQRPSPWQNDKIMFLSSIKDDDRRDIMRRADKPADKSPGRISRSPIKDRYRRHSPSPRSSRSPRRSWALEKRSPDPIREPPPPPVWPGQDPEPVIRQPKRFEPEPQETKHANVWERLDEARSFQDKIRVRTDLEDKFPPPRREFDDRRDYRDNVDRKQMDRDREFRRSADRNEFRRDSPRRDDRTTTKKVFSDIDKDFQDIYKRAVEFRKKTEERQKSGERRREEYEDRHKVEDRYRREESPRRSRSRERGEWKVKDRPRFFLSPNIKLKREKAIDEITNRIIDKYEIIGDQKIRVTDELRVTLANIFIEMFEDKDVSFIELVIKYQAKYPPNEEEKLFKEVLSRLPTHYRNLKRKSDGKDTSDIGTKSSRRSPPRANREENERPKLADAVIPEWTTGLAPPKVMTMSLSVDPAINLAAPGMVPPPVYFTPHIEMPNIYNQQLQYGDSSIPQPHFSADHMQQQYVDNHQHMIDNRQLLDNQLYEPDMQHKSNEYNLYLCQDDFEPFSSIQAEYLKNFIFNQIVKETESSDGWAPDITLKGLQSSYRYEISTSDGRSKDWVLNLNYAEFEFFNILVYTKEELWYERAAIWLPGHSRNRAVEPLDKLKMQNRQLEGANIGKWKFVKKVVTLKGTRLYVDMPPSSARALEKHKMMLSYELQKVNVFLKAVAVDKEVFDAGLKEVSITDPSLLTTAVQNTPLPTLNANSEPSIVKIGINGQKSLTVAEARKIKEVVVYHLVKCLQQGATSKTDFVKFGFCPPNYFGVVPENSESKKWLMSRDFGKMNRKMIVVFGDDNDNTKYFKMFAVISEEYNSSKSLAFERIKQSNQGVKGIHFNLWRPVNLTTGRKGATLEIEVDLESIETLSKMKYKLDYVGQYGVQVVSFHSEYSFSKLEEKIKKCKSEQVDSYVIANMELDSDSDNDNIWSKYVLKGSKYIPREREGRRVIDSSLKRSGAVLKNKYAPAQTNREMMKRPAFYDKSSYEAKRMKVIAQNYYEDANKALPKSNKEGAVKVTKKPVEPPSVEPTPEGHFELSPLLSKMVEVELQEVMKKVWELEPLDPKDEAEKLVCDRFKNKAGQGLRNTLGLNITKRLLNIYNPLYVKMVFGGKPPRAELMAFLKKHKISAFKSVSTRGVYAAKMRTCQDFDDLCNNNNLKCGKIRVTVTPCYQFMTCPTNLRTRYDCKNTHNYTEVATALTSQTETQEKVKTTKIVTTNVSPAKDNEANKSDVKTTSNNQSANNAALSTTNQGSTTKVDPKVTPGKTETQLKAEVTTPKVTPAKTENKPTVEVAEIKPQSNVAQNNPKPTAAKQTATAKTQIATPEPNVAAPNTVAKVTPSKPMPKTTPSKLTVASAKPAATNQNIPAKVTLAKTNNAAPNTNSAAKSTPAKPTVTQTQNSAPKVTQPTVKAVTTQPQDSATKVAAASPIATPKPIQNSTPVKKAAQNPNTSITTPKQNATQNSKIPNKPNANTKTPQTKPVVTAKTNTGKATSAKAANKTKVSPKAKVTPKKKQSDYDELDDHDILALISEGIVLDECSGSDME